MYPSTMVVRLRALGRISLPSDHTAWPGFQHFASLHPESIIAWLGDELLIIELVDDDPEREPAIRVRTLEKSWPDWTDEDREDHEIPSDPGWAYSEGLEGEGPNWMTAYIWWPASPEDISVWLDVWEQSGHQEARAHLYLCRSA